MDEIAILILIIIGGFILAEWLFLPLIISKGLESISDEIKKLGDK